jgi:hypothetical protein
MSIKQTINLYGNFHVHIVTIKRQEKESKQEMFCIYKS